MKGVGGKYDKLNEAIIFSKCLGINDIKALGSQKSNPQTGETELIDCLNITTTRDGALQKVPAYDTVLTHTAPVLKVSAGDRFLYQDAVDTKEWTGSAAVARFALVTGEICHTPIDCRVNNGVTIYKSTNAAPSTVVATALGTNPNPITSRTFDKMPLYDHAFVYNAKLYAVNTADKRFLQYSEDYHYDLYSLGDGFLMMPPIIEAAYIYSQKPDANGCILLTHTDAVTVLDGSGPHDFTNNYYPCNPIQKTLYSGWISKAYGYGHVFLCNDGVYMVNDDGVITNMTVGQTSYLADLNTSYVGSTLEDGKYLAYGDMICVEYDFLTKTITKRAASSIASTTSWRNKAYFAKASTVLKLAEATDNAVATSVSFPYSYLGKQGAKAVSDLYFTGISDGTMTITATDENEKSWTIELSDLATCYNRRIKTPRTVLGNHISFKVESEGGNFRLEELRANFIESQRSK